MIQFTIPLPPVTKKNSQQLAVRGGRPMAFPSKQFEQYQDNAGYFIRYKHAMIDKPVNVKALYYMATKRKVDISNLHSALHDVLVHYGVIADDSSINPPIVVSTDGSRVYVDKHNPRTEVCIQEVQQ